MLSFKQLREKKLTKAELKKREEVAKAIERDDPDMPMDKKMAIATSTAKRVAEAKVATSQTRGMPGSRGIMRPKTGPRGANKPKKVYEPTQGQLNNIRRRGEGLRSTTKFMDQVRSIAPSVYNHPKVQDIFRQHAETNESVNEVSAKTLSNYIKGASKDIGHTDYVRGLTKGQEMMGLKRPEDPAAKRKSQNRLVGLTTAADKLRRKAEKQSLNQSTNENVHDLRYDADIHFGHKGGVNVQRKDGDNYHVHLKSYNTKDDVHKFMKATGNDKTYTLTHFGKTIGGTRATLTKKTNNESIVKKGINIVATGVANKTKDPNVLRRWTNKAANKVVDLTKEENTILRKSGKKSRRGIWDAIRARREAGKPRLKPGQEGYPKTLKGHESVQHEGMTKSVNDARGVYAQLRRKRRREVNDDYSPQKLEWGTEASTKWAKSMTPGQSKV